MPRPKKRRRAGASLEMLVAALERALGGKEHIKVESPKFLEDKVTGELREHDVVVTLSGSHHASQIAIECRDRSRKITVNDVEAFYAKCVDTGIDHGVMVSPKGYSKPALAKAIHRDIRALTLGEVEQLDWMQTPGVHVQNRRIVHCNWTFNPSAEMNPRPLSFSVLLATGEVAAPRQLNAAANAEFFKNLGDDPAVGPARMNLVFTNPGLRIRDDLSGVEYDVANALVEIDYEITEELVPFRFVSYADAAAGGGITQAAVAQVTVDKFNGKIMCVTNADQTKSIVFVPESEAEGE